MSDLEFMAALVRGGSRGHLEGSDHLGAAVRDLSGLQINPQALGEVDAAHEFAAALARFAGAHGDDLALGVRVADDTVTELRASAGGYERHESSSARGFSGIGEEL